MVYTCLALITTVCAGNITGDEQSTFILLDYRQVIQLLWGKETNWAPSSIYEFLHETSSATFLQQYFPL